MALVTMKFPVARRYAKAGYAIRRASWGSEDSEHELAWVTYRFGLYHYTTATESRVVAAADVTAADLAATDWTLQGVAGNPVDVPPVDELPGSGGGDDDDDEETPGAGGGSGFGVGGGGSGGSGGGGGGGGGGPGDYPGGDGPGDMDDPNGGGGGDGGGGSGDGGGGGGNDPPRKPRQPATATAMTLTVDRTSGGCIPKIGGQPDQGEVDDTFSFSLNLSATTDAPVGLWTYSVKYGSPSGPKSASNGTIDPGETKDGTFAITAPRGQGPFKVWAKAYRPNTGYEASADAKAEMRTADCDTPLWRYPTLDAVLGAWLSTGAGGYDKIELVSENIFDHVEARDFLAAAYGVSTEDFAVAGGGLVWELQLFAGTPGIDFHWQLFDGLDPGPEGTVDGVDWVAT